MYNMCVFSYELCAMTASLPIHIIIIIYPLTTSSSSFPCSLLPSVTWRTPGLSIP